MKVLLLNGSPHKEGCTYTALKEIENTVNNLNKNAKDINAINTNFQIMKNHLL